MLNLYLHHHLDRKWRDRHRDLPLLRFADDLLVLCRTPEEGRKAYASLTELLTPAGFTLKEAESEAVRSLADGRSVRWMGYGIRLGDGVPEYTVTPDAWAELADKFAGAHERPLSPLAAFRSLSG